MQRLSYPDAASPPGLHIRSWERPELLDQVRYAPPRSYPGHPDLAPLPWSADSNTPSITLCLSLTVHGALQDVGTVHVANARDHLTHQAEAALAWLASETVRQWYLSHPRVHQGVFSALVRHIESETRRIGAADGCFIAISYLVRPSARAYALISSLTLLCARKGQSLWTPLLIEGWMVCSARKKGLLFRFQNWRQS